MSDTVYMGQLGVVRFLNVVLVLFLMQALWALATTTTAGALVCIPFVIALTWERARVARRVVRVLRLNGDDIELESVGLLGIARDVTRVKRSTSSHWRVSGNRLLGTDALKIRVPGMNDFVIYLDRMDADKLLQQGSPHCR